MVDTFERPHSSAFGAYSVTSHQRIQVLRSPRRPPLQLHLQATLRKRSRAHACHYNGSLMRFQVRRLLPIRPCVSVGAVESVNVSFV